MHPEVTIYLYFYRHKFKILLSEFYICTVLIIKIQATFKVFIKIIKGFSIFEKVNFLSYKFFSKKIKNFKIEKKVPKTAFGDPKKRMVYLF